MPRDVHLVAGLVEQRRKACRPAGGARTIARDGRRDRRDRDRAPRSAPARARCRSSISGGGRAASSRLRASSRCVTVTGSRPSVRGGGWWANSSGACEDGCLCMAITTVWLVYHSALSRQAIVIQPIKKAAPAATYLTRVCRLQSRGAICSWRICRTTNVLWSAQVISTLLISGLRSRISACAGIWHGMLPFSTSAFQLVPSIAGGGVVI